MNQLDQIRNLVAAAAKKPIDLPSDENLFDAGLLDSFALTDLVSSLESTFGITVPDSDLNPRKFSSLEKIAEYIADRS
ncbi:MAG: phosphopantetheine-binding protein [Bryobacter sp.]|nr:phosphopantetheine-binding protein [Bryobacter sp.]